MKRARSEAFAAWYVEDRSEDQLLLCDFRALIGFHKLYSVALLRAAGSAIPSRPDHVS